jgi:deoxyhypusine synthase
MAVRQCGFESHRFPRKGCQAHQEVDSMMQLLANGNMFLTLGVLSKDFVLTELVDDEFVKVATFKAKGLLDMAEQVFDTIAKREKPPRFLVVQSAGVGIGAYDVLADLARHEVTSAGTLLRVVNDSFQPRTRRPLFSY